MLILRRINIIILFLRRNRIELKLIKTTFKFCVFTQLYLLCISVNIKITTLTRFQIQLKNFLWRLKIIIYFSLFFSWWKNFEFIFVFFLILDITRNFIKGSIMNDLF